MYYLNFLSAVYNCTVQITVTVPILSVTICSVDQVGKNILTTVGNRLFFAKKKRKTIQHHAMKTHQIAIHDA